MFNAKVNNLERQFGGFQTTETNSEELESGGLYVKHEVPT